MSAYISKLTGVPADQLVALSAMLAGYPISILFNFLFDNSRRTPRITALKHVFSLIACSAIMLAFFDLYGWLNLVGISVATWSLSKVVDRKRVGPATMFVVLGHLAANHLRKQWTTTLGAQKTFDYTAALMVLAIKLTSYGFAVSDSSTPTEKLTPMQRARVIHKKPSLLEFMGFAFFWGGFLAGPAFDYALYAKWADGTLFDEMKAGEKTGTVNGTNGKADGSKSLERPRTLRPTLSILFTGLFFAAIYALFGSYGYHRLLTPVYTSLGPWSRFVAMNIAGVAARTKFYAAWKVAEGACSAVGLGSDGRLTNVRPWAIETAQSLKEYADAWNINTQSWLRYTVHERCKSWGLPVGELWIVFLTSSFWHGFYPGYYMTFLSLAVLISLARTIRSAVRPVFVAPSPYAAWKPGYDFITWLATQTFINYTVAPFMLLRWDKSWSAWASVGYWGHLVSLAVFVIFRAGGASWLAGVRRRLGVEMERARMRDVGRKKE